MSVAQDWKSRKLTDLAEYINGYAFKPEDWDKHGLPIIRIEQLKNPDSISDYFSGRLPEHNIIDHNDLIFSWSASLFLSIWKEEKAALNQHLFKVIEKEGVDRHFLKHFIEFYLPEIAKVSHGSTMQHITRKELDRFRAVFPCNKSEQIKIAEILSAVDQAIDQTEALIAKQQRIKTGLMQDLPTRGIDKDGNLRSEDTHEFKDSSLGRIPVEWDVKHLRDFALVKGGKRLPSGHSYAEEDTGLRYLRVLDFYKRIIDYSSLKNITYSTFKTLARYEIKTGDIAVSIAGSLGYFATVSPPDGIRTILTENAARIVSDNTVDPYFLSTMLNSQIVQRQIEEEKGTGGGVPKLALFRIETLCVPLPSEMDEQRRIYESLESNEAAILKNLESLYKLRSLKTALMQDLLTGKVSVTPLLTEAEISI